MPALALPSESPLNADSIGNGTRTRLDNGVPSGVDRRNSCHSHHPLSERQPSRDDRCRCGRGYSGRGLEPIELAKRDRRNGGTRVSGKRVGCPRCKLCCTEIVVLIGELKTSAKATSAAARTKADSASGRISSAHGLRWFCLREVTFCFVNERTLWILVVG